MPNLSEEQWRSFSNYLDQALELGEAERAPWFAALATADAAIAAEVARALSARERQGFAAFLSDSPLAPEQFAASGLSGRHVGPYVIESEVGRGGMGSVWRARRADGRFEGTVAIKFVHAHLLGRAGEERFRSEGRLLGRLDHPNIARLIDAGVSDDAQPYLVLEYVEGEAIDAYCDRLQLGIAARVTLFQSVLAAVGHAHSHLIIHRDLKPANVFVTKDGKVKLLDFGVAKLLEEDTDYAQTQTGAQALTPQYAAPEQLLGQPVTTATDVYALGLVLYVLLTGKHPMRADVRSSAELIHAVVTEDSPRASTVVASPTSKRRALEGDLDNILGKVLKKQPPERYASVEAFADDLRRYLADEPVRARPDTIPYRVAKFVRRNRGSVLGGLLVALGLITTSAFALVEMYDARTQRDVALAEVKRASAESDLTQFILDDKLSKLSANEERQRLDRARQFVGARFRRDPALMANLLFDVSGRYIDLGEYQTAADVIVDAEAIGHRLDDPDVLAEIACLRGQDLTIAREFAAARVQLAAGMAEMRRLSRPSIHAKAECATGDSLIAQADGDFNRAALRLREIVADLDRQGLHETGRYTSTSNNLGRALAMAGDYHAAWEVDNANLTLVKEIGRADTNGYLVMVSNGCAALRGGGQPKRALEFVDALTAKVRAESGDSAMPFNIVGCRGLNLLQMGRPAEAEPAILDAAATAERGSGTFQSGTFRAAAVTAALARGDLPAAEARWAHLKPDEARRLAANEKGADIVRLLLVHARLDLARQRPESAASSLERAATLIGARRQPVNADARELEGLRSAVFLVQGRYAEAAKYAQTAVELARVSAVDKNSSAWIGEALVLRARAEAALGGKAATATAQEALPHLMDNLDPSHPLIAEARQIVNRQ
jgi:serine/threonine-protein kinase